MLLHRQGPYLGHGNKCNTTVRQLATLCLICLHSTKSSTIAWPWVFKVESCLWLCQGFLEPNPTPGCVTDFRVESCKRCQMHFRIVRLSILFVPTPFFKDSQTRNLPGTSSDGWGDPLEQTCLGVGNSKTRRTLRQQLTIIYCLMFRERERERKSVRVYEQTQREC